MLPGLSLTVQAAVEFAIDGEHPPVLIRYLRTAPGAFVHGRVYCVVCGATQVFRRAGGPAPQPCRETVVPPGSGGYVEERLDGAQQFVGRVDGGSVATVGQFDEPGVGDVRDDAF